MGKGETALALTAACIAVDATAKRYSGSAHSSRTDFKKFVKDHLWLITYVGFPGLMASTVRVPFSHPKVKPDAAGSVGLEDIIYHVIRCSLVHMDDQAAKVKWNPHVALGLDQDGNLVLNQGLVWGLLAAVITSPLNKSEEVPDSYWVTIGSYKMFISEWWGRIDLAKRVVKLNTGVEF